MFNDGSNQLVLFTKSNVFNKFNFKIFSNEEGFNFNHKNDRT